MKVLELKSLHRDDDGIYYRRTFTGYTVIELMAESVELPIKFTIETSAFGGKTVDVDIDKTSINYPIVPLMTKLKQYVLSQDEEGLLP